MLQKKVQRESNLELFRILTMLLIVAHHYVVNSPLMALDGPVRSDPTSPASLFLLVFGAWGKIGINCFVLITGYFMCTSNITPKKFAKLLLEVVFYKAGINAIFMITGYAEMNWKGFLVESLPLRSVDTGFTAAFLLFYLCIPFLNVLIRHLTQRQHILLLLLVSFIYIFLGTFKFLFSISMNYVSWFIVLYLFASYVRRYPKKVFDNTAFWGIALLVTVLLSAFSVVWDAFAGRDLFYFVTDSNTALAVATGFSAFMFFKNWKIRYSPLVNGVASTCFGVLLIHANSETMRTWLWQDVCNTAGAYGKPWMALHAVGCVVAVFVVCSILDFIRIRCIETPFFILWDKHWDKIANAYFSLEKKVCSRFTSER